MGLGVQGIGILSHLPDVREKSQNESDSCGVVRTGVKSQIRSPLQQETAGYCRALLIVLSAGGPVLSPLDFVYLAMTYAIYSIHK